MVKYSRLKKKILLQLFLNKNRKFFYLLYLVHLHSSKSTIIGYLGFMWICFIYNNSIL